MPDPLDDLREKLRVLTKYDIDATVESDGAEFVAAADALAAVDQAARLGAAAERVRAMTTGFYVRDEVDRIVAEAARLTREQIVTTLRAEGDPSMAGGYHDAADLIEREGTCELWCVGRAGHTGNCYRRFEREAPDA